MYGKILLSYQQSRVQTRENLHKYKNVEYRSIRNEEQNWLTLFLWYIFVIEKNL